MFRRIDDAVGPGSLSIRFEGETIYAQPGDSLAAALLAHDAGAFRTTPVSGSPRAPYCLMGICFDCLVEVDGVPNRQACMVEVREGMHVRRQRGPAEIDGDR